MRTRVLVTALLLALVACSKKPKQGGLIADIRIDEMAQVTCVELTLTDPMKPGVPLFSKRFDRAGKSELQIAINQGGDDAMFPDAVAIRAMGYWSSSGCTDPKPNSAPSDQPARFVAGTVTRVDFTLRPPGPSEDGDGDGFIGPNAGGPDCEDSVRTINPLATEACALPGDLNCNGKVGCTDPVCSGLPCVRPPVTLVFASPSQSVVSLGCTQALVVEARDDTDMAAPVSANTPVTLSELGGGTMLGLQFFVDSGCTIPLTGPKDIPKGMREVRFYARSATAGLARIQADAAGLRAAQQDLRVIAGPPVALKFKTLPQTMAKSDLCSGAVTVEVRDQSGNPAPVIANVALGLTVTPSAGFALFSDGSCSATLSGPSFLSGTSSFTFFFKPARAPGTVTIAAAAMNLTGDSQDETVIPGDPAHIVFVTLTQSVVAGVCSTPMTLKLTDQQNTDAPAGAVTNLALSGTNITFYAGAGCTGSTITAASIAPGADRATVSFRATRVGAPVVTASGPGVGTAMQAQTVTPAPPVSLGILSGVQGLQTSQCSGPFTLATLDAFGNASPVTGTNALAITLSANPSSGFTFWSGLGCTGTMTTSTSIPVGMSSVSVSFRGTVTNTVTMTADSSLNPDPQQNVVIGVSPPDRLAFTTGVPVAKKANECSDIVTLEARDPGTNRSNVAAQVNIALGAAPTTNFQFFTDSQCTNPVTSIPMLANTAEVSFYWRGTTIGTFVMTPTSSLAPPGTRNAVVNPEAASAIVFTGTPPTAAAGACAGPLTVQAKDAFTNNAPVAGDLPLALSAVPTGTMTFHTDASCTGGIVSSTILNGASTTQFWARGTKVPSYNVTAQHSLVGSAPQTVTIVPAGINKLVVTTTQQTLRTGDCSNALTFERRDQFDNPIDNAAALPLTLSATTGSNITFYTTNTTGTCSGMIGAINIPANQPRVTVYFRALRPGMPDVTATAGTTSGSQQQIINVSPPSVLFFTSAPQLNVKAGVVSSAVVLESRDAFTNPSPVLADTPITLSMLPSTFVYCSDAGCGATITGAQINNGVSSTTFWFRGNAVGTFNIVANATGYGLGATQLNGVVASDIYQLKFTGGTSQGIAAGGCSAPVTVQRQDIYGNPIITGSTTVGLSAPASFTLYQSGGCTTPSSSFTINGAASTGSFNFRGTVPGTFALDAGSAGLLNDTCNQTIGVISANHLVYTSSPQAVVSTSTCSGAVTLEGRDQFNNMAAVGPNITITPSATGSANPNAAFFVEGTCMTAPVTNYVMGSGSMTTTYYFTATNTAGSPYTLTTAGNNGLSPSPTQPLTVTAGPMTKLAFANAGQNIGVDLCSASPALVRVLDVNNNPTVVGTGMGPLTITPALVSGLTFFSNAQCNAGAGGAFIVNDGEDGGSFYMKGGSLAQGSMVSVSVASTPVSYPLVAAQVETLVAGLASKLAITSTPKTLMAGECSTAFTVQARDSADNNTTVPGGLTVNVSAQLDAGTPTGLLFYSDNTCAALTTTANISANQGTSSFYVKGITGGSFELTAAANTYGSGTQPVTILPAVRTGTCTIADTATSATCSIIPALNATAFPSRTFVLFQATPGNVADIANNAVRCVLTDASTITCTRGGTVGAMDVRWYTVSRPTNLTVQHFNTITSGAAASQTVTLSPTVNTAQTFVLLSQEIGSVSANYSDPRLTTARLTANNQVTLQRMAPPDAGITYALQVVTWTGATVERGDAGTVIADNGTQISATLPDNAPNPAFLLNTWRWEGSTSAYQLCHLSVRGALATSSSVAFSRANGAGGSCDDDAMRVEFERVTLPGSGANRVDAVTIPSSSSSTTITAVDTTRTVAFFSGMGFGGGQSWGETSDNTSNTPRDGVARASITDPTTVTINRGPGAGNNALWTLFVWQFIP